MPASLSFAAIALRLVTPAACKQGRLWDAFAAAAVLCSPNVNKRSWRARRTRSEAYVDPVRPTLRAGRRALSGSDRAVFTKLYARHLCTEETPAPQRSANCAYFVKFAPERVSKKAPPDRPWRGNVGRALAARYGSDRPQWAPTGRRGKRQHNGPKGAWGAYPCCRTSPGFMPSPVSEWMFA